MNDPLDEAGQMRRNNNAMQTQNEQIFMRMDDLMKENVQLKKLYRALQDD